MLTRLIGVSACSLASIIPDPVALLKEFSTLFSENKIVFD
jgi:hypothetical protein